MNTATSTIDRPSDGQRAPRAVLSWVALYGAIALDVVQVFALVYSDGFTQPLPVTVALVAFLAELLLFTLALRRIQSSVAYALFGLSTVAVAGVSIGWLGEPLTPVKAIALLAVVTGAVLLNTEPAHTRRDDVLAAAALAVTALPTTERRGSGLE
jgi:multidrug transporter EmrE-like cation transporter